LTVDFRLVVIRIEIAWIGPVAYIYNEFAWNAGSLACVGAAGGKKSHNDHLHARTGNHVLRLTRAFCPVNAKLRVSRTQRFQAKPCYTELGIKRSRGIHGVMAQQYFIIALRRPAETECNTVKYWATTLAILTLLSAALALAEDFKTVNGKVYKDATIRRVEADGIVLKTTAGISKVYFVELPRDVQERFHYNPAKTPLPRREIEPIKVTPKQNQSPPADASGWAGALQVSAGFVKYLAIGALAITGLVLVIIRSRS
jgi:hypothetical protein